MPSAPVAAPEITAAASLTRVVSTPITSAALSFSRSEYNAGSGNLGVLQSGAVENSNVDLTAELVSMITAQRVYQANAQTVRTQDQILQTLVNLR